MKGIQTAGRGLVDSQGGFTPRADAAAEIGRILKEHRTAFTNYDPEQPRVAIIYDKLTHDFTKAFTLTVPDETNIYINSIAGLYECLWELNIPAKFITPDDVKNGKASAFGTLFLTNQLTIGSELAAALKQFAEQGGTIIADGKFGEIKEDSLMNEHLPGGDLNADLGYHLIDIDPLELQISLHGEELSSLPGYFERKMLSVTSPDVDVLGSYSDNSPGVLHSPVGKGRILYISTMLWYGYHKEPSADVRKWVQHLDALYSLSLHSITDSRLKLCSLKGEDGMLLFVFNYTNESISSDVRLNGIDSELETVACISHSCKLESRQELERVSLGVTIPAKDVGIYKLSWRDKCVTSSIQRIESSTNSAAAKPGMANLFRRQTYRPMAETSCS